jgi:hypothetical protein
VPALLPGPAEPMHKHPPDFDPEELEGHHGQQTWSEDPSAEFGVSLLIPMGGENETTLLGGAAVPSLQMVELRCSVANVTQRIFTI